MRWRLVCSGAERQAASGVPRPPSAASARAEPRHVSPARSEVPGATGPRLLHAIGAGQRVQRALAALQALRGVHRTVAITLVAAIGDRSRCATPRDLRKFLGLLPAEDSSGDRRQQGAMTQAGHTPARRARVAGAWASRSPAKGSRHWPLRLAQPPKMIQDMHWQAQGRRCKRSRPLGARGKQATIVTVAMARELAGCMRAMAKQLPVAA